MRVPRLGPLFLQLLRATPPSDSPCSSQLLLQRLRFRDIHCLPWDLRCYAAPTRHVFFLESVLSEVQSHSAEWLPLFLLVLLSRLGEKLLGI